MKSLSRCILIMLMILVLSNFVYSEPIKVLVENVQLQLPIEPVIIEGRTLVPLRAIFEALGAKVEWDQATRSVTGIQGDRIIKLQIDNKIALVNGEEVKLDAAATIINGSTLVPVRFIAESLGAEVKWDNNTRSVLVNSDIPQMKATSKETTNPLPLVTQVPKQDTNLSTGEYKGSIKSDKYHYPNYTHNGQISDQNLIWFESIEHAQSLGYKPCGICFR